MQTFIYLDNSATTQPSEPVIQAVEHAMRESWFNPSALYKPSMETQKEVEAALGLTGYRPVHELLKRERKREKQGIPKQRGRKPARTLQEYKYENKRLKMEVELLRDFVSLTGKE